MIRVSLIAAVTADGFIARSRAELVDWSSTEDKKRFVELTKRAGVYVMGGTTYRTIGRALPGRRCIVYSRGQIADEGVETTTETPAELIARLSSEGCTEVAICGGSAIYDMFLTAGVVTDLYLTIEPLLFGDGIRLASTHHDSRLKLIDTEKLNQDTLAVHYEVLR